MSIVKLASESDWDSIINNHDLFPEEERRFIEFIVNRGLEPKELALSSLKSLFDEWNLSERYPEPQADSPAPRKAGR
jgi:hypothetical protein